MLLGQNAVRESLSPRPNKELENGADEALANAANAWLNVSAIKPRPRARRRAVDAYVAELERVIAQGAAADKGQVYPRRQRLSREEIHLDLRRRWLGIRYRLRRLDHVLASGEDVNVIVFDTEVYSNTGGQASKASNIGQVAQFAAAGKDIKKKSLAEIAIAYGYVYVAQVAMGAKPAQLMKAITEAEAYRGPSLIIGYSPCEMHAIKGGMANCMVEMEKAVDCGYWNLSTATTRLLLRAKEVYAGFQRAQGRLSGVLDERSSLQPFDARVPRSRRRALRAKRACGRR